MKNKTYTRDSKASCIERDTFGSIYESMVLSDVFQRLSCGARVFYMYCRVQATSKDNRLWLFTLADERDTIKDGCFTFQPTRLAEFGIKRQNAQKYIHELMAAGFIEIIDNCCHARIYKFSDKWQGALYG